MAELTNTGFEEAGTLPGEALGWTISSTTQASASTLFESFEEGWGNTTLEPDTLPASFGGGLSRESFERLWGPFDGTDPNLPDAVAPGLYTENASFRTQLTTTAAGPPLEQFSDVSWGSATFALDISEVTTIAGDFESFETGWNNDAFATELVGDVLASFYVFEPETIESFERVIDGHELVDVVLDPPPAGDYTIEINGRDFTFPAEVGDDEDDIANGLIAKINETTTYPYSASYYTGSIVVVKNLGLAPMLIVVSGPEPGAIVLVSSDINVNFWLMPLDL